MSLPRYDIHDTLELHDPPLLSMGDGHPWNEHGANVRDKRSFPKIVSCSEEVKVVSGARLQDARLHACEPRGQGRWISSS